MLVVSLVVVPGTSLLIKSTQLPIQTPNRNRITRTLTTPNYRKIHKHQSKQQTSSKPTTFPAIHRFRPAAIHPSPILQRPPVQSKIYGKAPKPILGTRYMFQPIRTFTGHISKLSYKQYIRLSKKTLVTWQLKFYADRTHNWPSTLPTSLNAPLNELANLPQGGIFLKVQEP